MALLPLGCALLASTWIYFRPPALKPLDGLAYAPDAWTFIAVLSRYLEHFSVYLPCLFSMAAGCLLWRFPRSRLCLALAIIGYILAVLTALWGSFIVHFNPPAVIVVL